MIKAMALYVSLTLGRKFTNWMRRLEFGVFSKVDICTFMSSVELVLLVN
jgi:hypothetical protein